MERSQYKLSLGMKKSQLKQFEYLNYYHKQKILLHIGTINNETRLRPLLLHHT